MGQLDSRAEPHRVGSGCGGLGGAPMGKGRHHEHEHRLDEEEIQSRDWSTCTRLANGRHAKLHTTLPMACGAGGGMDSCGAGSGCPMTYPPGGGDSGDSGTGV
jgi:hypothetical protein